MTMPNMKNQSTLRQGVEGVMNGMVGTNLKSWSGRTEQEMDRAEKLVTEGYNQALADIRSRIPSVVDEILELVGKDIQTILTEKLLIKCECEDADCSNCKRLYEVMETIASLAGDGTEGNDK